MAKQDILRIKAMKEKYTFSELVEIMNEKFEMWRVSLPDSNLIIAKLVCENYSDKAIDLMIESK